MKRNPIKFRRMLHWKNPFPILKMAIDRRKKIILLDTPSHGNVGDHAIALAEKKFLKDMFPNETIYQFQQKRYVKWKNIFLRRIKPEDIILIHGGGFIGTLWKNEEEVLVDILKSFGKNRIVIMPQTVYFSEDEDGDETLKELNEALADCKDIHIFLRDKKSFEFAQKNFSIPAPNIHRSPDIVSYLKWDGKDFQRDGIVMCMRKDKEKNLKNTHFEELKCALEKTGETITETDMVEPMQILTNRKSRQMVKEKMTHFAKAKLVVTDRLHGMYLTVLTGTPCIIFDNVSKKVSGGREWLTHIDYIYMGDDPATIENLQSIIDSSGKSKYSNECLSSYYDELAKVIRG